MKLPKSADSNSTRAPESDRESGALAIVELPADRRSGWLLPLVPAAVTLAVTSWGLGGPSYWLDEAATLGITRRTLPQMFATFTNVDLVHAAYYLFLHFWIHLVGTSEFATRFPSAVAMAAAAWGVVLIGRELGGARLGLLAGLLFAGNATVSSFAEQARSAAMVAAAATWATWLFMRAVAGRSRPEWIRYGIAVALLGVLNIFGLLLVAAHGSTLLWRSGFPQDLQKALSDRVVREWIKATAIAGLVVSPYLLAVVSQHAQVSWIPSPTRSTPWAIAVFYSGSRPLDFVMVPLAVLGCVLARGRLRQVTVPWLLAPAVILLGASILHPVFLTRYLLCSMPAFALLTASVLDRLFDRRRIGQLVAVALIGTIVCLTVPRLNHDHRQSATLDDLRAAADYFRSHEQPGDAVLYLDAISRWAALAYPEPYQALNDVTMAVGGDPTTQNNLRGLDVDDVTLQRRLRAVDRVWVIRGRSIKRPLEPGVRTRLRLLRQAGFVALPSYRYKGGTATLMVRRG